MGIATDVGEWADIDHRSVARPVVVETAIAAATVIQ